MKNLILGATGNLAQQFINIYDQDKEIVLFVRDKKRLQSQNNHYSVIEGDMYDYKTIIPALEDADIVLSFVGSSPMPLFANNLLKAIQESNSNVKRILWLGAAGANKETIGREGSFWKTMPEYFGQQKDAIDIIINSQIPYTIINPAMFNTKKEQKAIITQSDTQVAEVQSVSRQTVARVFNNSLINNQYINQQITVGDSY
ncbi:MAG: SDR family oxidoreductase [Lactobacillaceae bacterium]|jgi:putative NADH-flavin reductase|nr:SDR family oxidoreductase [Lactobacillaceae bacterium]